MEWHPYRLQGERRGVAREILKGEEFACAFCKGTGGLRKTNSQCPVCRGRGVVKITPPAMVCAYCRGRGEFPVRSNITCIVCGGKGVVSVPEPIEVCPSCRGTGAARESKLPCLRCRGKGVVTAVRQERDLGAKQ